VSQYRYVQYTSRLKRYVVVFTADVAVVANYVNYLLDSFVVRPKERAPIQEQFLRKTSWDLEEFHNFHMVINTVSAALSNFNLQEDPEIRSRKPKMHQTP